MTKFSEPIRDSHVAVLAFFPVGAHAGPLLAVTRRLAAASPSTIFSFFNTARSNASLFSSDHPENIKVHDVSDGVPEGTMLRNPLEMVELFLEAAPRIFRSEIAAAEIEVGKKVTCMLTDAFFWFAADIAAELNATWVAFWAGGANSLCAHLYTDLIRETIGLKDVSMEETLGFIPGMENYRVKDIPEEVVFEDLDSVFPKALYQMSLALPRASAVFISSFEELEPTLNYNLRSKLKRFLNIAPLTLLSSTSEKEMRDPHGCFAWMGKRSAASVAYISFGTVMEPPPEELLAIAQGLESSKVPFVWSLKEKNMVHLPKGFLDRTREQGIVVPWAPQVELLKHEAMGVNVTHCGWNSVLESVSAGVPMIGRPILADNRLNGRAVEVVWKVGVMMDNGVFTKEGFEKCLNDVFVHDDGKTMKANAKKLKEKLHEDFSMKGSSFENFKELLDEIVKV
ncbi:UDP-glucuronosyl/UDP-glucosyltransferase [Arabidopsis thaliana x Arabidopsis arenosa]|uniref:UGT78D1 n=2 Tax=Arabidopsis TaxID=3701 RepID=A0A178W6E8_ARATH|nr:UDP-glucuronosyl/UDP-glucosyltransferase [Arabidopsis thaliana x Arabidopsis arenosa]OAP13716.1 UGT78D1 [Arabidopsis thaliana]